MAIKSWPYVSISGDRKTTAGEEAQGYELFLESGVVPGYVNELAVTKASSSLNVSIAAGAAVVAGHRVIVDAPETIAVSAGESNPRIDIIVLESNENTPVRAARLVVVKGTAAATPAPPTLTQDNVIWQMPLAQITVPAGAANLNSATLTDARVYSSGRHGHATLPTLRVLSNLAAGQSGVVNVMYGTGNPPDAATVPNGTLFIKYVP